MTTNEQMAVLCCDCGTVRTVTAGYVRIGSERRLRCATCSRTTWHGSAVGVSDHRERANTRAILRTSDLWAVVEARGVQVVEVPQLSTPGYWIEDERILLVRSGLSPEHVRDVVAWALRQIGGHHNTR